MKTILLKLRGRFIDITCKANVIYKRVQKVIYILVLRSIYWCIESELQWYTIYTVILQKKGFVINTYDRCVVNKIIEEKKCTIVWYVDDNNASHMNPKVIDDIISDLKVH